MTQKILRFADLKSHGGCCNWPQLRRLCVEKNGFPPGRMLGENSRFWTERESRLGSSYIPPCRQARGGRMMEQIDLDPDLVVQEAARFLIETPKAQRPRPAVVEVQSRYPLDAQGACAALGWPNSIRAGGVE